MAESGDVIELAPTGRAKCRACGESVAKGSLRFGERVPNPYGEGEATHWFHLTCAAEQRPEKLAAPLQAQAGDIPNRDELFRIVEQGRQNPKLGSVRRAEQAPSGRARCQHCREPIEKGGWRIAFEREPEPMAVAAVSYLHLRCGPAYFGEAGLRDKLLRLSDGLPAAELDEALGAAH
jgi:hypothetical protein